MWSRGYCPNAFVKSARDWLDFANSRIWGNRSSYRRDLRSAWISHGSGPNRMLSTSRIPSRAALRCPSIKPSERPSTKPSEWPSTKPSERPRWMSFSNADMDSVCMAFDLDCLARFRTRSSSFSASKVYNRNDVSTSPETPSDSHASQTSSLRSAWTGLAFNARRARRPSGVPPKRS